MNGAREIARRLRRIQSGSLKPANGLTVAPVIVAPELVIEIPVPKRKRVRKQKIVVEDRVPGDVVLLAGA